MRTKASPVPGSVSAQLPNLTGVSGARARADAVCARSVREAGGRLIVLVH